MLVTTNPNRCQRPLRTSDGQKCIAGIGILQYWEKYFTASSLGYCNTYCSNAGYCSKVFCGDLQNPFKFRPPIEHLEHFDAVTGGQERASRANPTEPLAASSHFRFFLAHPTIMGHSYRSDSLPHEQRWYPRWTPRRPNRAAKSRVDCSTFHGYWLDDATYPVHNISSTRGAHRSRD